MRIVALLPVVLALLATPAVAQEDAAPRASRDLARGTVLTAADLVAAQGGATAAGIGWVTRRVVREGEELRPPTIARPNVVSGGDTVRLVWEGSGMSISMRGRALGSAAVGEKVSVRVDTQRRFEGVATEPGVVRITSR